MAHKLQSRPWGWLVLFASATTLVCCALPILLVSLGLGAVWATIYANFAAVGFVAQHEGWFFGGSAALLALGIFVLYRPGRSCPVDPVLAAKCQSVDALNKRLLVLAVFIWLAGFGAAYLALPLSQFLSG